MFLGNQRWHSAEEVQSGSPFYDFDEQMLTAPRHPDKNSDHNSPCVADQVRFYRMSAATNFAHAGGGGTLPARQVLEMDNVNEPLPLEKIPALVFSEIMRDLDLFVGVASVGNDPTWQDGGPGGRYVEYWRHYFFGEISATAVSRGDILERMLPKLKIA